VDSRGITAEPTLNEPGYEPTPSKHRHNAKPDWPNGDPVSSAQHASGHGQKAKAGCGRKRLARRRQDIIISLFFAGGVIAALALVAEFGLSWVSRPISGAALNTADIEDPQIGTLTVQTDENKCELMKFDNETGRTIENTARCRNDVTMDAHGAPVPVGTVHRLDAISKSFLAGEH
jgi:hypothetical protein